EQQHPNRDQGGRDDETPAGQGVPSRLTPPAPPAVAGSATAGGDTGYSGSSSQPVRSWPSRLACQYLPVSTCRPVSHPDPYTSVAMHTAWPRFRGSPLFCREWPHTITLPEQCGRESSSSFSQRSM